MDRATTTGRPQVASTLLAVACLALGCSAVVASSTASRAHAAPAPSVDGYWMVDQRGHVYAFGDAPHLGEGTYGTVDIASTRTGAGYWTVTAAGVVVRRGDAVDLGGPPPLAPGETVVAIAGDPRSDGAWLFTSRGNVHHRGGAAPLGGVGGLVLNQPIVDAAPTPSGDGYWMVAADGGVFASGGARFFGSMGGRHLNRPVVGFAPTPSGDGYWLVADDGGIFSFGPGATFRGSMGGRHLNRPVNGMVGAGDGYVLVADDGGIFSFGPGAPFHGSLGSWPPPYPVVAVTPLPTGTHPPGLGANPPFLFRVDAADTARLWASWRPGCPVGPSSLRLVTVDYWDMWGYLRTGELVVHADAATDVVEAMRRLHAARFPIATMELVDLYWGSDDASMAANNTSAFNCRAVTGGTGWSEHAYGRAIDVNPVENPYVRGATVLPPAGRDHLVRDPDTPGLIVDGDAAVQAFAAVGWAWGGLWSSPTDYQHFSASGR